jgi:F0F1-type ATP synthase assembly protein I
MEEKNQSNPNQNNNSPKPDNKSPNNNNLMGLGMQIVAQVVVGVFIGLWLDRHFETKNSVYTIICATLMIVVALYQFIRQSTKN